MPDDVPVQCPYCGETTWLVVDASAGAQAYVEDCQVCCRPINVVIGEDDGDAGGPGVRVARDDA